jgi:hypothetical protein
MRYVIERLSLRFDRRVPFIGILWDARLLAFHRGYPFASNGTNALANILRNVPRGTPIYRLFDCVICLLPCLSIAITLRSQFPVASAQVWSRADVRPKANAEKS